MNENMGRQYKLGRDVTESAQAQKERSTIVLSVRLSGSELAHLEKLSRESGKTISQVARQAIAAYQGPAKQGQPQVSIGLYDGTTVSMSTAPIVSGQIPSVKIEGFGKPTAVGG